MGDPELLAGHSVLCAYQTPHQYSGTLIIGLFTRAPGPESGFESGSQSTLGEVVRVWI